ncbi:MAG TPA: hypothetical protein ENI34_06180 [candidate division WOR-3 bacterium]|uniref:Uncharacterized protein n=1 Tax=candidate division WOR-3 bacterium TaxID=2052148 RepID=A0A9C9EMB0_UNCW3|nr:hypothetical protein [candidate division WOR-3 bacterium]
MRVLKYIAFFAAVITIFFALVTRFVITARLLFGLTPTAYLRFTAVMLLFAIALHLLFEKR